MLTHRKAIDHQGRPTRSTQGFTLIELLVVIIILGVLAAVVIFAVGSIKKRAETNSCKADTKTLKTAIVAWNTEYLGNNPDYPTPWPTLGSAESALATAPHKLIQETSSLHNMTGGSANPPFIVAELGKCQDEGTIAQIS